MELEGEISQKKFKNDYQRAAINIIYTNNWLNRFYAENFKPQGITQQQYNILRILRGQHPHPVSIKLIRERMLDKMSDASRIVEKLRLKKLINRNICPDDRRNVDVTITEKGLNILKSLDVIDSKAEQYLSNLNKKEIKLLNELLDKLRG